MPDYDDGDPQLVGRHWVGIPIERQLIINPWASIFSVHEWRILGMVSIIHLSMKTTFNNLHRGRMDSKRFFGGTIITASNIGNQNIMGALSFICSTSSSDLSS